MYTSRGTNIMNNVCVLIYKYSHGDLVHKSPLFIYKVMFAIIYLSSLPPGSTHVKINNVVVENCCSSPCKVQRGKSTEFSFTFTPGTQAHPSYIHVHVTTIANSIQCSDYSILSLTHTHARTHTHTHTHTRPGLPGPESECLW